MVNSITTSLAETTWDNKTPKINLPAVFSFIDGIKQIKYSTAVNKYLPFINRVAASRISNNRLYVFFISQKTANEFVEKRLRIHVKKLINPSKRLILSDIHSTIPGDAILQARYNVNIRTTS